MLPIQVLWGAIESCTHKLVEWNLIFESYTIFYVHKWNERCVFPWPMARISTYNSSRTPGNTIQEEIRCLPLAAATVQNRRIILFNYSSRSLFHWTFAIFHSESLFSFISRYRCHSAPLTATLPMSGIGSGGSLWGCTLWRWINMSTKIATLFELYIAEIFFYGTFRKYPHNHRFSIFMWCVRKSAHINLSQFVCWSKSKHIIFHRRCPRAHSKIILSGDKYTWIRHQSVSGWVFVIRRHIYIFFSFKRIYELVGIGLPSTSYMRLNEKNIFRRRSFSMRSFFGSFGTDGNCNFQAQNTPNEYKRDAHIHMNTHTHTQIYILYVFVQRMVMRSFIREHWA